MCNLTKAHKNVFSTCFVFSSCFNGEGNYGENFTPNSAKNFLICQKKHIE